jgi:hypothetical protein
LGHTSTLPIVDDGGAGRADKIGDRDGAATSAIVDWQSAELRTIKFKVPRCPVAEVLQTASKTGLRVY